MFAFTYSKTAISFNILLVLQILCLRNIYIFRSPIYICIHNIQSMQFPFITYMVWHSLWHYNINDGMPANTNIEKNLYMRASLENFCIFTFKNCYFFQYFVGTLGTLSVQTTYLSAYMYRQISKCTDKTPKTHYGGGGPPPSRSGYASASGFNYYWNTRQVLRPCTSSRANYLQNLLCDSCNYKQTSTYLDGRINYGQCVDVWWWFYCFIVLKLFYISECT